ncbi:MAG: hypothetical protein Kow0029_29550 [Candidatus Rifleibacteriota bacterium]
MRKSLLKLGVSAFVFCALSSAYSSPTGDLEYLGYSEDILKEIKNEVEISDITANEEGCEIEDAKLATDDIDEAASTQEQLFELANTRAIRADMNDRSLQIKTKIDNFWEKMHPKASDQELTDEIRAQLNSKLHETLTLNGFTVVQLELLDLPEGSLKDKFRAVVRVTRPLKTRNSYKEIQENLVEIKKLCSQAAFIDGKNYLSELTTFVAENPKNKYYYEKTILTP